MQLEVTRVLLTEFVKLVRIAPFPGTFSRFYWGLYYLTPLGPFPVHATS